MNRYLAILCLFFLPLICGGQEVNISEIITNIAEELAADDSDAEGVSVFIERLHELAEDPVYLNSAGEEEISRLFFLSDFQVKALADYIHSSGRILSLFELAAIPGFDKETAITILPFVRLESKNMIYSDSSVWRNSLISNFTIKPGKSDTSSLGSAWRILTKYKFKSGGFSGGVTIEKDPGEKFLNGNPPLPDFLSAHIAYNGNGVIKRIIIGDYSARFGQGSNINTGMRRSISITSPGYMSASDEIKPYTSTEENRFLRGVAASFSAGKLDLSTFFSDKRSDATITTSTDTVYEYIDNFYQGGVHNTASLLKKKDAVSELAYGLALSYNYNNLKAGFVWSETRFSLPVNPSVNDPEKVFDFTGNRNNLYSLYYNYFIKKILLYGELSASDFRKLALIQGMSFRPSDRLTFNFLFRNYNSGFRTFIGNGPGSGSNTSNEMGILGNFTFEAARHLFISGGYDIQYFPWLKYRCSAPSKGVKRELKVRYIPSDKIVIDASYSYRLSMQDSAAVSGIPSQVNIISSSIRASARYSVNENLTLGTRIDYKIVNPSGNIGFVMLQDINYSFRRLPVTLWIRYCIFNADNWLSRIYTYENDLLYSFSIPALAGRGSRCYAMAKWKISDSLELRIKYGVTSVIADGDSVNNTDEIKLQFRIWF
jgi:hypothetical protein